MLLSSVRERNLKLVVGTDQSNFQNWMVLSSHVCEVSKIRFLWNLLFFETVRGFCKHNHTVCCGFQSLGCLKLQTSIEKFEFAVLLTTAMTAVLHPLVSMLVIVFPTWFLIFPDIIKTPFQNISISRLRGDNRSPTRVD